MAHKHSVYDSDAHFSINPKTRVLKREASAKKGLVQYDHNSERFTFEIPRWVEEHDMSLCNVVQIHYINIDSKTKEHKRGIYEVDDMQISPESDDVVILSWLISQNATQLVGSLNFLIRFACVADDGTLEYIWNTAAYGGIAVSNGIYNTNTIIEEYPDIFEALKVEIFNALEESESKTSGFLEECRNSLAEYGDILEQWRTEVLTTVEDLSKNLKVEKSITVGDKAFIAKDDGSVQSGTGHTVTATGVNKVSGKKHTVKDKVHKSDGNTVGGTQNTLDGVQNSKVNGKGNKLLGSDKSGWYGGSQSEVSGLNNTIDATGDYGDCPNVHLSGEGHTARHRNVDIGGKGNRSSAREQFIRGTFNKDDPDAVAIFGNGASDTARLNAAVIKKNGNAEFAGRIDSSGGIRCLGDIVSASGGGHFSKDVYVNNKKLLTERIVEVYPQSKALYLYDAKNNYEYRYGELKTIAIATLDPLAPNDYCSFSVLFKSGETPTQIVKQTKEELETTWYAGTHLYAYNSKIPAPNGDRVTLDSSLLYDDTSVPVIVPENISRASIWYGVKSLAGADEYVDDRDLWGTVDISGWKAGDTINEITFVRNDNYGEEVDIVWGGGQCWTIEIYTKSPNPILPFFVGNHCMSGVFTPLRNTDYKIDFEWNGYNWQARVSNLGDIGSALKSTGDTTDRFTEIQELLNQYKYLKLGEGDFYISGQLRIADGAVLEGCGAATRIMQTPDSTATSMIWLQSEGTLKNVCVQGEWTAQPKKIDTPYEKYRTGVVISGGTKNAIISGCFIRGWTACGVAGVKNSMATRSFIMSDCDCSFNNTGLKLEETEYACVSHCVFRNNIYGVENMAGNNKFSVCGFDQNIYGFVISKGVNNGHGSAVGCTFNHNEEEETGKGRAVSVTDTESGFVFSACQFHFGSIMIGVGVQGIMFNGCQFGNSVDYQNYSEKPTVFTGCLFSRHPYISDGGYGSATFWDPPGKFRFIDCIDYVKDEPIDNTPSETWTFTLADGSTVAKAVRVK